MKSEDFETFQALVQQRSGLVLPEEKAYLMEARLLPVARRHNFKSIEDMAQVLRLKREEPLVADIAEAMMATETTFFRDRKQFDFFRSTLLPGLMDLRRQQKQIRIWSAGCATGQEAYSLAMICAEEAVNLQGWQIEIIGTDLSRVAVAQARSGTYSQFEVQRGLPIRLLVKYFQQLSGDKWQIRDNLRQMVRFADGNLLGEINPGGKFDVVYCRDVLGHLEIRTQSRVVSAIAEFMQPDGCLLLGQGELPAGIFDKFHEMLGKDWLYVPNAA